MAHLLLNPHQLTYGQQIAAEVEGACDRIIADWLGDDTEQQRLLYAVVAGGRFHWRKVFRRAMSPFPIADDLADGMYNTAAAIVRRRAAGELAKQPAAFIATYALDRLPAEQRPMTIVDVLRDIQVVDGSSDDTRRILYGRDGNAQRAMDARVDRRVRELQGGHPGALPERAVVPEDEDA